MVSILFLIVVGASFPGPSLGLVRRQGGVEKTLAQGRSEDVAYPDYGHPSWLPACEQIYLDIGTNIGVQIRKLFEPEKYPEAQIRSTFDSTFGDAGNRSKTVCALGMEPSPTHRARLQALEKAYNDRGFRIHIYPFAAWDEEGTLDFRTDMKDFDEQTDSINSDHEEWGAHLNFFQGMVPVRTVCIADFIKSLPQGRIKYMKLDIEGSEWAVLAKAFEQNLMCYDVIPKIGMEVHGWGNITTWKDSRDMTAVQRQLKNQDCAQSSPTEIGKVDDESYLHDVDDSFKI